ncbi:rod shape-determining protein RodA [Pelagicoccus sp. SDUM812002]|uniref:rod shape-determining protein RodA n=1 Tax=Pelagicoccus sp. SDUM812002 TaxID=3041266 RepID=UPI0028103829|nr:rod shape-determining protein RodA [Pelagicoccus sp. SDUM812002]MDQ8186263.1 rod shape-determining protein RodA [Pelagicoccus sp. SDUM812002]
MLHSSQKHHHPRVDLINPICMLLLASIGILFIYSAQYSRGGTEWHSQIAWLFIGLSIYTAVSLTDYALFMKYSHWLWLTAVVMLILVKFSPLGVTIYGATRWLNLGFYTFQPVEIAKLAGIVISASILTRSEVGDVKDSLQVLAKMALAISVPFLLILAQPDLGSALVIPIFVFAQLYASNLSKRFFTTAILVFVALVGAILIDNHNYVKFLDENGIDPQNIDRRYQETTWFPLKDYQRNRILTFVNPDKADPRGTGWNREQSIISVASGGLFGKGVRQGSQAQLGYLPRSVAHNDFIFSVLAEEAGFIGSAVVISLFGIVLANSLRIAGQAKDRFGTLLVLGVVALFSVHVFVNIAMTIGLMPITGLPLPFLSHGGTFMVSCCILLGLVQSVYRYRKDF